MSGGYPSVTSAASSSSVATFSNRFDYSSGVTYNAGDVCTVAGIRQVCREDHVSGATPDLSKWTPTEGTDGFATTVASVMTTAANKPATAGIHVFLVVPSDGLPSGAAKGDMCYFNGVEWSVFRTYSAAPPAFQAGNVQWYKYKGTWYYDTDWASMAPQILASTTNPTLPTTHTKIMRHRIIKDEMQVAFTYFAASSAGHSPGVGTFKIPLPAGTIINTSVAPVMSTYSQTRGSCVGAEASSLGAALVGGTNSAIVIGNSDNSLSIYLNQSVLAVTELNCCWGHNAFGIENARTVVKFVANVPIKRSWEA